MFLLCLVILLSLIAAYAPELNAAPLTFPAAAPISAGDITYRQQPGFTSGTQGHKQFDAESVLVYGLSHNVAFILENNLPQYAEQTYQTPTVHTESALGPGDISFLPRYTFWEKDGIGTTNRLSALGGVLIPVGVHSGSSAYGPVPRSLEPGAGAWGTKDGLIFTRQTLDAEVDGYGGFVHHGASNGYQFGNEYFADDSLQRRIRPKTFSQGVPKVETYLVLETNFLVNERDKESPLAGRLSTPAASFLTDQGALPPAPEASTLSDAADLIGMTPNLTSGGTLLQFDPGIRFVGLNWGFAALAEVPAFESVNGGGFKHNYGILLVYRHVFYTKHHL